ncbi:MAG: aminotransferase [Gammaproteobacteria bacterium]|nr:aminotransferase [Gammaproteobacteria bacterium]MDH4315643.1 aminotransferase [Gammaproteobacteria bacterium]MDH5214456.1 aminotransferase [Gammaproteobacteria bacterium]
MVPKSSARTDASDLADIDRRYAFHPFTGLAEHEKSGPATVMVRGEGVWLHDNRDRRYLDGMAGLWCVNVGYGRREIGEAMHSQAITLPYCHAFSSQCSDIPTLLAERIIQMAPVPMSKVFFGNSGSDANDTQVKLVWYYNNSRGKPLKKKIISRQRGYHGVTIMSGGMTGLSGIHSGFDLPLSFVKHTTAPHRLWEGFGLGDSDFVAKLVSDLERLIEKEGAETIGAMIVEPVMGAGGVIVPPAGYHEAIRQVLDHHDILLIADEVICGFGRLGHMFGSQAVGLQPDLVTIAKGVTSAYFPLSGCLVSEKVWRTIVDGGKKYGVFGHGYTYSAHPIGAAVAMANLDIVDKENLVAAAASKGAYMHEQLRAAFADHPMVGEIRGFGLIGAVELVSRQDPPLAFDPKLGVAGRVAKKAMQNGVITRALPSADTLAFSPPLIVSTSEIDTLVSGVRDALDEVQEQLGSEGVWQP